MGEAIYEVAGCVACHGYGGQSVGGAAADLRMRLPANLEYLKAVWVEHSPRVCQRWS
jgi:mono/diheme cytochrome c family protein